MCVQYYNTERLLRVVRLIVGDKNAYKKLVRPDDEPLKYRFTAAASMCVLYVICVYNNIYVYVFIYCAENTIEQVRVYAYAYYNVDRAGFPSE